MYFLLVSEIFGISSIHVFQTTGTRMFPFWILLELRMMVTTGATSRAKLQSNCYCQQTNTQLFTGWIPSSHRTNSVKAVKRESIAFHRLAHLMPTFQPYLWALKAPGYLEWRTAMPLSSSVTPIPPNMLWNAKNKIYLEHFTDHIISNLGNSKVVLSLSRFKLWVFADNYVKILYFCHNFVCHNFTR